MFLKEIWKDMSDEEVKIVGRMDSKTLERAMVSKTRVSNRRLRTDVTAIKNWIDNRE